MMFTRSRSSGIPNGPAAPAPTYLADERAAHLTASLVEVGRISPTQLAEAQLQQAASGKSVYGLLVELGALDERDLAAELSRQFGFALADLREELPPVEILALVPESVARANTAIPLRVTDGRLQVAVGDPLDVTLPGRIAAAAQPRNGQKVPQPSPNGTAGAARTATDYGIDLLVAPASDILRAIEASYRTLVDVDRLVQAFEATDIVRAATAATAAPGPDDAPIVQLVTRIITQGLRDRASDIHIEPQDGRVRVRFRIDGALHDVLALPAAMGPAVVSRLKIMADLNIADRRRSQDGQVALEIDGRPIDVRINTCPTVWGEKAALRVLDRRRVLFRLDDLGMPPDTHGTFSRMLHAPYGMVICSGPTGSGKTTTLYAALAEIDKTERNVTTIEDPVEYVFPGITQIEISEQSGMNFATGLRAILRQDPDVILVGEIRDAATAKIAVESALTGHLVLSSIHATDSVGALLRLIDMGIEPFLVVSTVIGVSSQRLVRQICDRCKAAYKPAVEELSFCESRGWADAQDFGFQQGHGCNFCSRTGYQDRLGLFELLRMTDDFKRMVVAGAGGDALRAAAAADGTRSLVSEGLARVAGHQTTVSEIMRASYTA